MKMLRRWRNWCRPQYARQQLALAVQWGCKDYYDDIGKRQQPTDILVEILLIWVDYIGLYIIMSGKFFQKKSKKFRVVFVRFSSIW